MTWKWIHGGVTASKGFWGAGTSCGIKKSGKPDIGMIVSETPAHAFGVFTKNQVKSPTVLLDQKLIRGKKVHGIVVNSGNANACTGKQGMADAVAMTRESEERLHLSKNTMLVCSTGIIGERLPMAKVKRGIAALARQAGTKN